MVEALIAGGIIGLIVGALLLFLIYLLPRKGKGKFEK